MAVYEALTEAECALVALLQDRSGIDLAEFSMFSAEHADGCWRAWPFQFPWWRSEEALQIDLAGRSVGKSQGILIRARSFPFNYPGQEMVIGAPELIHLKLITDKIEQQLMSTRLTKEVLVHNGGKGAFGHLPFDAKFQNQSRIVGRIPQRDGRGFKGIHPIQLELDESQDLPEDAWTEAIETLKTSKAGAVWRAHGVTKGVRGHFYKYTQPGSGWKVHRITAMSRPTWTSAERNQKIEQYGSRDDPDYRRNVLGAHGDATQNLFVYARLAKCVDMNPESDYNTSEYYSVRITDDILRDSGMPISALVDLPAAHRKKEYVNFWVGMDVGWTIAPSEILVFGEKMGATAKDPTILKLLTRISLIRTDAPDQGEVMAKVMDFYKPVIFAMDSTGAGLPLLQIMQKFYPQNVDRIRGYNFSSKILVDFDMTVSVDENLGGDLERDAGIQKNVLEHGQDMLRGLVDERRIQLPFDRNLVGQFEGGTSRPLAKVDQYGRRRVFSGGEDHCLDAARMLALGYTQHNIEKMLKRPEVEDVVDIFMVDL